MSQNKFVIHWVCWQPTPYNNYLFRSLAQQDDVGLTVHFTSSVLQSHPWKLSAAQGFNSRTFQYSYGLDWQILKLAIVDKSSFFIIAGWHNITLLLVISILAFLGRPYALWTDTPNMASRRTMKAFLRSTWLKWVFKRASGVMGTGQVALERLSKMGSPQNKLINFPFSVDLEAYTPTLNKYDKREDGSLAPVRFVSSGRISNKIKGHDLALAALAKAQQLTGVSRFEYYIAGTGPDLNALQKQQKELGLNEQVKLLGWLEADEVADLFRNCDILIHPSHYDPFPVAVLEGMAAGLGILGSNACGSVVDRVVNGENGFIHQVGNIDELASHIALLLEQPDLARQLSVNARLTAEKWPVSRSVQIIKSLIAKGQNILPPACLQDGVQEKAIEG